ncbi:GMP synthetase [Gammaproteobacteria bacterium]
MNDDIQQHKILILDFGSQYTQLIARRVRELGVYCEVYPYDVSAKAITDFLPQGIILSGGPNTVTAKKSPRAPKIIFELGCPVLGICYGMQTMAAQLQGCVINSKRHEYGYANLKIADNSNLLSGLQGEIDVWMSHGDKVTKLPDGFRAVGSTSNTLYAAIENKNKNFYGLQFHPEVTHTKHGGVILKRFVVGICGCKKIWTTSNIINDLVKKIKETVGNDKVLLGLSGGVDSAVTALLLERAIGNNLTCVFVDTGMLRHREAEQTIALFAKHFKLNLIPVYKEKHFLKALAGVSDPEAKRKIIGREFIQVFTDVIKTLKGMHWLAQGTIYSDVIESAQMKFGKAEVIKSHHNVGGLPKKMQLQLIEPMRELFKDEVRRIGLKLGLSKEIVNRHPFPGPGLGIRVLGEICRPYLDKLRQADHIFLEELYQENLYNKVSQAFAVFLPIKSVGVMGDQRKYECVIALRAVTSSDFMTAHWAQLPAKFLGRVSNRIVNEVPGISRVVYDITGKPPATIEWE